VLLSTHPVIIVRKLRFPTPFYWRSF